MAINAGTATLDTPPADLIKALMPARNGTRNPMRDPDLETSKLSKTASASAMITTTPLSTLLPPPYPYPMSLYPYYNPYGPPSHQIVPPVHTTVSVDAHVQIVSSPVNSESDLAERLMEYVDWIAKKSPSQTELFIECKEALRKTGHTIRTVKNLTDGQFEKMGISDGIAMQLRSQLKRFEKAMMMHA
jgi:hypothetical protein